MIEIFFDDLILNSNLAYTGFINLECVDSEGNPTISKGIARVFQQGIFKILYISNINLTNGLGTSGNVDIATLPEELQSLRGCVYCFPINVSGDYNLRLDITTEHIIKIRNMSTTKALPNNYNVSLTAIYI